MKEQENNATSEFLVIDSCAMETFQLVLTSQMLFTTNLLQRKQRSDDRVDLLYFF